MGSNWENLTIQTGAERAKEEITSDLIEERQNGFGFREEASHSFANSLCLDQKTSKLTVKRRLRKEK